MYNLFQEKLKQVFSSSKGTFTLNLHKWSHTSEYIFSHVQYMDEKFDTFELPLGLVNLELVDGNVDVALVKNAFLQELKGKISFVTTNFELDPKAKSIVSFLMGNGDSIENDLDLAICVNCDDRVLQCFPSFVLESYHCFLKELASPLELEKLMGTAVLFSQKVEFMFQLVIQENAPKALSLDSYNFKPPKDIDDIYKTHLKDTNSSNIIFRTRALVNMKKYLVDPNQFTPYQWQLLEFLSYISVFTYKLVCDHTRTPSSHQLLQHLKYELFLFNQMFEMFPSKFNLLSRGIYKVFEEYFIKVEAYHKSLQTKADILMATYLSPDSRRFLQASDVQSIRTEVFKNRYPISTIDSTFGEDESLGVVDGFVMEAFQCSGSLSPECFSFESFPSGRCPTRDLVGFWKKNHLDFPTLAAVARRVLPIQTGTGRGLGEFKANFDRILTSVQQSQLCSIESFYFVYCLSREIDLICASSGDTRIEQFQHSCHKPTIVHKSSISARDLHLPQSD
ncbi:hypothetical protein CANTEDRAFT_137258 [Yamadazyma tenuis ATCC 10573]|uniref:HAT C-terminal dimerisation domain-containing protein n=2 Tax=Candida tenuis TaxID=2315449 RepID=G3BC49_CANTC|nr:uncharacterized protein CANTEDRAFT_137258 [Yamadazyma tenuis ATCC 10573]EGV60786.1 hypothetical protein CANTEDRAFT_137258 [Yamadazyma tenuis ATCC 10573]